jgi:hypothetical protein
MYPKFHVSQRSCRFTVVGLSIVLLLFLSLPVEAQSLLGTRVGTDPYTNPDSQHQTATEPSAFTFGTTTVISFQVGRFASGGGSDNIAFATSTDHGTTWRQGLLPGTTVLAHPPGVYARISNAVVTYDSRHRQWLIASLGVADTPFGLAGVAVLVSRSSDGVTWSNPVTVQHVSGNNVVDKPWIVCDNTTTSPFYGHCYVQWTGGNPTDFSSVRILLSRSSNGGATWESPKSTANAIAAFGGQPLVQPSGKVIVPIVGVDQNGNSSTILSFTSGDGGQSWSSTETVTSVQFHQDNGGIRSDVVPSAGVDASGRVYVIWPDCRFEQGCLANDLVLVTSGDGIAWSAVQRIPLDPIGSGVDHFIPGLAVHAQLSGDDAQLALDYYYYPDTACTADTCQLDVGFIVSGDGGRSWSGKTQLAGPMKLSWLASSNLGQDVGDYISTIIDDAGRALPVYIVATPPSTSGQFHEAVYIG